jgi:hypothetical protein
MDRWRQTAIIIEVMRGFRRLRGRRIGSDGDVHVPSGVTPGVLCLWLLTSWALAVPPAELPGNGPDAGQTVVYRDTWGVAHIYAPSVEAGLFAMGWAQAQDQPEELLKNMLRGMGELAINATMRLRSHNFQ